MQKHPMLSVKEAAAALGCDERWIREKLNQGQLKGEKRNIGLKEKWFVYRGEIDAALAKRIGAKPLSPSSYESDSVYFDASPEEAIDVELESAATAEGTTITPGLEEVVRVIANQFAERLDQQKELNFRMQRELEDKERQLRLIPDLQKQLAQAQNKELELVAVRKQVQALEEERRERDEALKRMVELEGRILPALEQQLSEERTTKQQELEAFQRKLSELEEEKSKAELATTRVEELEAAMLKHREEERVREEESRRETEKMKLEYSEQERLIQEQLAAMQAEMKRLKEPWWKKFLGMVPPDDSSITGG